jgi:hypothetical protein
MLLRALPILALAACVSRSHAAPDELRAAAGPGLTAIRGAALLAHVRFLADDLLEGRGSGTRGHAIAARYVAAQLAALGLEPAGEGGSWFQEVPLRAASLDRAGSSLAIDGVALVPDEQVILGASTLAEEIRVAGPLVHVGFGRGEGELATDLEGKIAVIDWGAPDVGPDGRPLSATARAVASDVTAKSKALAARGARALLVVHSRDFETVRPWARLVDGNRFERVDFLDGDRPGSGPRLPMAVLSRDTFARLLARAPGAPKPEALWAQLKAGKGAPLALGAKAELVLRSKHRRFTSENVAGLLRGGDPRRAGEVVVLSAHLDHLGIGEPVDGDAIYNGAIDNATGVAAILEIARGMTALRAPPPRSILFLAVTAEEKGLVGSEYFAARPTLPIERLVANINIDGLFPIVEPEGVVARGMEHSTLEAHVRAAAATAGVSVDADPIPEQVIFIRSDQYNFVKRGVPAIFPGIGFGGEAKRALNGPLARRWFGEHYHRPSDQPGPELRADRLERETRTYFLIALSVARAAERPRWKPESPFNPRN